MAEHDTTRARQQLQVVATPRQVWDLLADPDRRRAFLGGDLDVDLSPGSRGTFRDGHDRRAVEVHDVEEFRRLRFTWDDGHDPSTVDIVLEPAGDDTTEVTVTETRARRVARPAAPPATEPLALAA